MDTRCIALRRGQFFLCARQVPSEGPGHFYLRSRCIQHRHRFGRGWLGAAGPRCGSATQHGDGGRSLAAHSHRIGRFASSANVLPSGEPLHRCMLYRMSGFSPLILSPMFRLDSDPEPDTPAPRTPPLSVLGLEAMPMPQCADSPTSSVDFGMPYIDFRQISSPRSAWSCSTDVSDRSRRTRDRIKRRRVTPLRGRETTRP